MTKNRTTALSPFSNGVIEKAIVAAPSSFFRTEKVTKTLISSVISPQTSIVAFPSEEQPNSPRSLRESCNQCRRPDTNSTVSIPIQNGWSSSSAFCYGIETLGSPGCADSWTGSDAAGRIPTTEIAAILLKFHGLIRHLDFLPRFARWGSPQYQTFQEFSLFHCRLKAGNWL